MNPSQARSRVPTLDGWRAVAIGLVVWHHFVTGWYFREPEYYSASISRFGAFGVDVFFAISGLIITTLLVREFSESGRIGFRGFYTRRAFRILPPCFLYLSAVLALGAIRTPLELLGSALFFRNYIPEPATTRLTGHLWSLSVEEHFYLFWPLLLSAILTRRGVKRAAEVAAWISIGCGLWRVADAQYGFGERLFPLVPRHFRTDLRLDALLWGCTAALWLADADQRERLKRGFKEWMFWAIAAACAGCMMLYSQLTSLWLAILIPAALAGTVLHPAWIASRILEMRWMRFVGRISYSLYLWQQLFLAPGWERAGFEPSAPWNLLCAAGAAIASYFAVEKPLIAVGRRISRRFETRTTGSCSQMAVPVR